MSEIDTPVEQTGNISIYILDSNDHLVPIGIAGELCFSGKAMEHYHGIRTENPFVSGLQMYRTGNMARWLPGGKVELLGKSTKSEVEKAPVLAPFLAARNEWETLLVNLWKEVLGIQKISVNDDFFKLGGHSLKAVQLMTRIRKKTQQRITLRDIFLHSTLSVQATFIQQAGRQRLKNIPLISQQDSYPLSNAQERFWVLNQFPESSLAYNMAFALLLKGRLDITLLKNAVQAAVSRHESLRTIFRQDNSGEVRQYILPETSNCFLWESSDISQQTNTDHLLKEIYSAEQLTAFDLENGPLLRVQIVKVSHDTHAFFYTMHHIISDGWSMQVLAKEVIAAYNGAIADLPPLRIQYKDYAAWLGSQLQGDTLKEHEQYWLEQLEADLPVLELPSSNVRPAIKTHHGDSISDIFPVADLQRFCNKEGVTIFMVLLAGIKALFYRYTGQEDIIVGSPFAGREHHELEDQIGNYLNTLPLRTRFSGTDSFIELVQKEKEVLLGAYNHQVYPLDMLIKKLTLNRDFSRSALFDVLVELHNQEDINIYNSSIGFDGLSVSNLEITATETSQFDLTFSFTEVNDHLRLLLTYNTDIFDKEEMLRMSRHYQQLLVNMLIAPDEQICKVEYLDDAEKHQLLYSFNDNAVPLPAATTVLQVLAANVQLYKDLPAIIYQGVTTTYLELDIAAANIANHLYFDHHLSKGSLVVILLERSAQFIAAIMGIWRCGAAYVPVDPEYPEYRINIIIEGAAPALIISNDKLINRFSLEDTGIPIVNIDAVGDDHDELNVDVSPSDLAYVIFTSGSTGRPKGVMIEHAGMLNHLFAKINDLSLSADAVVCQNASPSFDISVWQFFVALMTGGRTVIYSNDEILDPDGFIAKIITERINILELVPSYLSLLLDTIKNKNLQLKYLLVTGETLKPRLVEKWFGQYPHIPMVNAYGPTEASDDITHHIMYAAPHSKSIPIGRPVQNMCIYILDTHMQLCPVGIPGEIYVAGIGVGRGYLNDPGKTAAVFLTDPFSVDKGVRMYRTGDIGKLLQDGSIEFFGRKDQQVKIRGNRIELEEIETTIIKHPDVKEAIVLVKEGTDGMLLLVAYIVSEVSAEVSGIREYLNGQLPDYMIPSFIIQIENIPLTANGKIDRNALPEPDDMDISQGQQYIPPGNYVEEQLVSIWEAVLGRNNIGIKDNFFSLGGHSLGIVRILNAVQMEFDVKVDIRELFENPTIEQLSQEINLLMALEEPAGDNNKEIII